MHCSVKEVEVSNGGITNYLCGWGEEWTGKRWLPIPVFWRGLGAWRRQDFSVGVGEDKWSGGYARTLNSAGVHSGMEGWSELPSVGST